jgi:hypothetical protein
VESHHSEHHGKGAANYRQRNHTTVNMAKVQPTTDREINATKTAQKEINDKNWDHTNGHLLMIFESLAQYLVPSIRHRTLSYA